MMSKNVKERRLLTIAVKPEVKSKLDALKLIPDETYSNVIKRLIEGKCRYCATPFLSSRE